MKRPTVLLSLLVVLLIGASGLAIFLYLGARDRAVEETRRLGEVTSTLEQNNRELADLKNQNDTVLRYISTHEANIAGLRKCAGPAKEAVAAAKRENNDAELRAAVRNMEANC